MATKKNKNIKVRDLKPRKDAKGGGGHSIAGAGIAGAGVAGAGVAGKGGAVAGKGGAVDSGIGSS